MEEEPPPTQTLIASIDLEDDVKDSNCNRCKGAIGHDPLVVYNEANNTACHLCCFTQHQPSTAASSASRYDQLRVLNCFNEKNVQDCLTLLGITPPPTATVSDFDYDGVEVIESQNLVDGNNATTARTM